MINHPILEKIKFTINEFDPEAKIIVFGSHARGDARKYSDWDLLVLSSKQNSQKVIKQLKHKILNIEIEEGEVISPLIYDLIEWDQMKGLPLYENIEKEGIEI